MSNERKKMAARSAKSLTQQFPDEPKNQIANDTAGLSPLRTENEAMADAVDEYIRQFEDTQFGQVVNLGDPKKYRKAIEQLPIDSSGKVSKSAHAQIVTKRVLLIPYIELHLRFSPLGKLTPKQHRTLYHEATHMIEWLHNDLRDRSDPTAERNTDYLDRLVDALRSWKRSEKLLMEGRYTPAEAQGKFNYLRCQLELLEKEFKPDLSNLHAWTGFPGVKFDDIQDCYLHSDWEPLRQLAMQHHAVDIFISLSLLIAQCNGWNHPIGCNCGFGPRKKTQ